jgi:hypothetical protein
VAPNTAAETHQGIRSKRELSPYTGVQRHPGIALAGADQRPSPRGAERIGFTEVAETYEVDWLAAPDRPARRELPDGYTLLARPEQTGPHPMIKRNGDAVEARLQRCSLDDPELDLPVTAPDSQVAAHAMCWVNRRTGVGLVEPMRGGRRPAPRRPR